MVADLAHVCSCECTDPTLKMGTVRLGENHVSLALDTLEEGSATAVWLNGYLERYVIEAFAGRTDGWVLRYTDALHLARSPRSAGLSACRHGCMERVYGDVSIMREAP